MPSPSATLIDDGIFRILVCRTSHSLGNTLFITPLLQELEQHWPGAEVDVVTRYASTRQVFSSYATIRDLFVLPKNAFRKPLEWLGTLWRLRRKRYDLVIDADLRSRTGRQLVRFARGRHKLGFAPRGGVTVAVDLSNAPSHAAHFPVFLLRSALGKLDREYPPLSIQLKPAERRGGGRRLLQVMGDKPPACGVIGIFANATGPKAMAPEWWSGFMREAESHLSGYAIVEIIPAFGRSMLEDRYPAYYSSDIRHLSRLLSSLDLLISLDCGIMHLARASGTPVGAVFTATDVDIWGPYGRGSFVVKGNPNRPKAAAQALLDGIPIARAPAAA